MLWRVPDRVPEVMVIEAKGKLNMALRLIMMVMTVRAEVLTTIVDVHKSFASL